MGKVFTIEKIQKTAKRLNGKPLTINQATAIKVYAETGNKSEAGRQAYPNQTPAAQRIQGHDTLTLPNVENVFYALMDEKGLTDGYILENIKKGMDTASVKEKHIDYTRLALQIKGKLKNVNVNLSQSIKETRRTYNLD